MEISVACLVPSRYVRALGAASGVVTVQDGHDFDRRDAYHFRNLATSGDRGHGDVRHPDVATALVTHTWRPIFDGHG
jgi:hypothetical protein